MYKPGVSFHAHDLHVFELHCRFVVLNLNQTRSKVGFEQIKILLKPDVPSSYIQFMDVSFDLQP